MDHAELGHIVTGQSGPEDVSNLWICYPLGVRENYHAREESDDHPCAFNHKVGSWPLRSIYGSDIHVMLALRRRSRQVVVTNEKFNGPDMVGELLGKGQRVADQPGHALPQRVVEPFDVIGFAG